MEHKKRLKWKTDHIKHEEAETTEDNKKGSTENDGNGDNLQLKTEDLRNPGTQ